MLPSTQPLILTLGQPVAQRCYSPARTCCAFSAVHLHRKKTHWLCRQRACVCQAIQQKRLESSLLREGSRKMEGGSE
ncbi:hypothetical protein AMECASPLE_031031 [Ameca splendens]|uniref:Uncharacterized protein n=1 Tax=Ameca splendens TaxID=208324 RepID=A0ABV0ZRF9_9TELE